MKSITSLRAIAVLGAGMVLAPQSAFAQDADAAQDETGNATYSGEIIVTAQGRSQALSDVPIAVSAVSGEVLQKSGINDIRDLTQVAPSLLVSSTGNEANGSARVRGIGTVGDNPGLESSVVVFVDNVYRSRSGNALSELGPIESIEIRRGPQGTLGGRNSSAGVISVNTAPPEFVLSGHGAISYGNFDAIRVEAGINAPISDTIAARIDGVYFERDGFIKDAVNNTTVNDRDRYLIRAQALFEPTEDITFHLIGDYSRKEEACCAATFVQPDFAPLATVSPGLDSFARPTSGVPLTSTQNPIIPILLALGQNPAALNQSTFERTIYPTAGRTYEGVTEDYGISGELNWTLGDVTLTAITAYREFFNNQASDTDYTGVDILFRAPGRDAGARDFETFTQELRFNGSAFNDRLDWLVGGFYTNEKLQTRDNLRFGTQYGTFAACRIALAINPALANPGATDCFGANIAALTGANNGAGAFGAATPLIVQGITNLSNVRDVGGTGDEFNQRSESIAFFTHNILHVTDKLDLTLGLRYTDESKKMNATFGNDNVFCPQNRQLLSGLLGGPLAGLAGGLIALSCQGNSNAELDGVTIRDNRNEDELTGTAVLSYKVDPDLLLYGSYTRGYKAGGFNLDRSALANPLFLDANNINTANLQFDQETVNAFEIGAKYTSRSFSLSVAAFRQEFSDFQLNTFNGSVFLVQTVNACQTDLGGADLDASATTGACAPDDVKFGVVAQGFELEANVSPLPDVTATFGLTYTDTSYEDNLIGNNTGAPLDPALRLLPGDNLSNAPEVTGTASISWTPELTSDGMRGLVFFNARMVSDFNTGSDLLFGKEQDGFVIVNGRIGLTNIADRFSIEGWVQNLFNKDYTQVAFNTPFVAPQQTFSAFLAEPRTYGVTLRGKF
ncbi:MAG: TonB-dependent receptor [Alphaproteobacteria bacterium]|nr:TonB-dependent receptor [Alphaproteobacteria bacterium]